VVSALPALDQPVAVYDTGNCTAAFYTVQPRTWLCVLTVSVRG